MINKKQVNYSVSKTLRDAFLITANVKGDNMSNIIETAMLDYIVINKAEVNEKLLDSINTNEENTKMKIDEINNIEKR